MMRGWSPGPFSDPRNKRRRAVITFAFCFALALALFVMVRACVLGV